MKKKSKIHQEYHIVHSRKIIEIIHLSQDRHFPCLIVDYFVFGLMIDPFFLHLIFHQIGFDLFYLHLTVH